MVCEEGRRIRKIEGKRSERIHQEAVDRSDICTRMEDREVHQRGEDENKF